MSNHGGAAVNDHVASKIEDAFPAVPLGSGLRDLQMFVDELHGGSPSIGDVTNWRELAEALIERPSESGPGIYLAFLEGAAWREILPAWMVAASRLAANQRLAENFVVPVLGTIDLEITKDTGGSEATHQNRVNGMSRDQREAVGEFVRWAVTLPSVKDDKRSAPLIERLIAAWPVPQEAG